MKRERGSLTVEAAIVLVIFIFGYAAIVSVTSFIRAQMIIQYSLNQAAKEISAYCYIVSKTGLMEDSANLNEEANEFKKSTDEVINTIPKFVLAIEEGTDNIANSAKAPPKEMSIESILDSVDATGDVAQEEYQKIIAASNQIVTDTTAYFKNKQGILSGLASVAKEGAFNYAKSYIIAAPISKALVSEQIELYNSDKSDSRTKDVLEVLGVVDGIDGLNFSGSTLFNDGESITVQVAYTMKVNYPGFEKKKFHFIQTASTRAWGSKVGDRHWRK